LGRKKNLDLRPHFDWNIEQDQGVGGLLFCDTTPFEDLL
jgi:hypothetical protein